jgi:hypothetical protein
MILSNCPVPVLSVRESVNLILERLKELIGLMFDFELVFDFPDNVVNTHTFVFTDGKNGVLVEGVLTEEHRVIQFDFHEKQFRVQKFYVENKN